MARPQVPGTWRSTSIATCPMATAWVTPLHSLRRLRRQRVGRHARADAAAPRRCPGAYERSAFRGNDKGRAIDDAPRVCTSTAPATLPKPRDTWSAARPAHLKRSIRTAAISTTGHRQLRSDLPVHDPRYVLVVMADEPKARSIPTATPPRLGGGLCGAPDHRTFGPASRHSSC